jgi:hypothetical protein
MNATIKAGTNTRISSASKLSAIPLMLALGFPEPGQSMVIGSYFEPAAATPPWTQVASACAPDEAAQHKFTATEADVGFRSGLVTEETVEGSAPYYWPYTAAIPVVARCNVAGAMDHGAPSWNGLVIGYSDPDGSGPTARVTARLVRVSRPWGSTEVIATFDSNRTDNPANTERHEEAVQFFHSFDFSENEYFVQFSVSRSNANLIPAVFSLRLTTLEKIPG